MALNTKLLQKAVGDLIADRIGSDLSQLKGKPSIVSARTGNTQLKYPYATIDIIDIFDSNAAITNVSLDSEGRSVYETHTDVVFQISVRSNNRASYSLARKVHKAFSFETYRNRIYEDAEATIATLSPLNPIPDVLSTTQIEFNVFTVTLRVNDVEVVDEGYISNINSTLNLDTGDEVLSTDIENAYVDLWDTDAYQYSGSWVFNDTWGFE